MSAADAADRLGVDPDRGLDVHDAGRRLTEYGPNELPTEPPPCVWVVARGQPSNPTNIMLMIVGAASLAIGQVATAVVVLGLVPFNVVMGSNPELKAHDTLLEAGDVVPADGRILISSSLEVHEAALTGESAPVPKDRTQLPAGDVALGDRTNLVFQNARVPLQ